MATDVRPIQIRRGNEVDYDKSKMLPGEFAVSLDQKKLRIAFAPGDDKQVAFSSEVQEVQNNLDYEVSQLEGNLATADEDITAIQGNISRINTILNGKVDEAYLSEDRKYLILKANGELVAELGPFAGEGGGGGGGGGGTQTVMTISNESGWLMKTVAKDTSLSVQCTWSSTLDEIPTGAGILRVYVDGAVRQSRNVNQGTFTVNLDSYLVSAGNKSIRVNVTDVYGTSKDIRYTVVVEDFSISSSFDTYTPVTGAFTFYYTPKGTGTKTVHFLIDGEMELSTETVETSDRQQQKTIPAQTHGTHTLEVWFAVTMDEESVQSNHLWYDFMSVDSQSSVPIISSQFNGDTAEQYQTIAIPYQVYDPAGLTAQIELIVGAETIQTITVDRTEQTWSYRPLDYGEKVFKIKCGNTVKEFTITIAQSDASIGAVTEDLALYLTAQGRSNGEEHPEVWTYGTGASTISATLTGFNWVSDGWQLDEDNVSVLRVSNGASVTIPYQIFAQDLRTAGATIEVEYSTRNVADYSTTVFSCWSGGRGLKITPQDAILVSEQTSLDMQYKENEHIRLAYVIGKNSGSRLVTAYIDAIPARTTQYPSDDDFSQTTPAGITIGSDDCTIDIYCIRIYTNDLTVEQVRGNWIADTQDVDTMMARYDRNNIYDTYGNIVLERLPQDTPYIIIDCEEMPQYKGDKKTATVTFVDPANPANNWTATGVQINVQGTSSSTYEVKNTDFQMKNGFELVTGHADKWALRGEEESIPTNRFVGKQDVASSESANNTQGTRFYNDLCPYTFAEQREDSRVRWGIDGIQVIEFWRKTSTGALKFMGKVNFNYPKRFKDGYGYSSNRESVEFENNTSNLLLYKTDYFDMTPYVDADSGETRPTWRQDFEFRFPDDTWLDITKLQEWQTWVVSTCREQATGNALSQSVTYDGTTYTTDSSAYRLAKFRNEFSLRGQLETFLYYYIYTEFFLMVDSRAKNLFIGEKGDAVTLSGSTIERKLCAEPYDMDTQMGINNEGTLGFPYWLEDTDTYDSANVFNGQTSTLWCNIRDAFGTDIKAMYQTLRSKPTKGLNYTEVETRYETAQAHWPEAIWAEDAKVKYTDPLTNPAPGKQPTAFYLPMCQGSKEQQRKSWLSKRFAYMDSKWNAGDALGQVIQLRGYAKSNISVTPYINLYCSVKYGSYLVQQRGVAGTAYTLTCPIDELNDTEIYVYSAPWIASVGDISGLKVGVADFSQAVNIQEIKVGDSSNSYENTNMKSLSFGSNKLLKKADVRNCSGLGTKEQKSVDMSGCEILEEAYFEGTSIQGLQLPTTGSIKKLHLPDTMTNITIINQRNITEFVCSDFSNVSTLRLENVASVINSKAILEDITAASRVRLIGFYWTATDADEIGDILDILDTMRGLDEQGNTIAVADGGCHSTVSGEIHTSSLTGSQIAAFNARYPYISVTADHTSATLSFYNGNTLITTQTIIDGGNGSYTGTTPTKTADAQYTYTFAGWSKDTDDNTVDADALTHVVGDRNVYACFTGTLRKYTVTWKSMGTTVETDSNVPYGSLPHFDGTMPSYDGQTASGWDRDLTQPITGDTTINAVYVPMYTVTFKTGADDGNATLASVRVAEGSTPVYSGATPTTTRGSSTDFTFTGWTPALGPVYANTTYTAVFRDNRSPVITYLAHTIPEYESTNNTSKIAAYAFYKQSGLTRVKAPVTTVESNAFNECNALETVDLSATSGTVTIQATAFVTCPNLTHLIIRSSTKATLSNISALTGTKIEKFFGAVYVPTALVDDYKADSNWKNFWIADISEYPIASFEPSETWAQIEANGAANVMIGQSKTAQIDGKQVYFTLIGKSKDDLTAGGKANSTWLMMDIMEYYQMNNSGTTAGGYDASKMKTHITTDLLPTFELKDLIKEVVKTSRLSDGTLQTTNEKLWLASAREMYGSNNSYESSGCTYNDFFSSDAKRIKRINGSAYGLWLRSAYSSSSFWYVSGSGIADYNNASGSFGVVLGFCL